MTLREFCTLHGGKKGNMVEISDKFGFTSIKTVDGTCFLSFAKTQFGTDVSVSQAKRLMSSEDLDVLETESTAGNTCFVIVKHSDLYEAFDF